MGHQRLVAFLNFLGFWVIGIPVGCTLTFVAHVGLKGLWWGMAAGLCCTAFLAMSRITFVDWHKEARNAYDRASKAEEMDRNPLRDSQTVVSDSDIDIELH